MTKLKKLPKKLALKHCNVTLRAETETVDVRGNAMASGDDEADRKDEDEIIARLNRGDVWAWAFVVVTVTPKDVYLGTFEETFTGSDSLGCCSYKDERDFRQPGGYFDDMCKAALADLQLKVDALREIL